ncbi:MAG TPA: helix-hairpin-helix domain-containing protein [Bryobacteraceae bacterium]|jgi:competence protein ComEA
MKKFGLLLCLCPIVVLAQDNAFPDGPGKPTLEKICTACHDLGPLSGMTGGADIWQSVVDDMKVRGADGTEQEFKDIVTYLSKYLGAPVKINTDTAASLEANLQITTAEAGAIVKYRTDKGNFKTWDDITKVPGLDMTKLDGLQKRIKY